MNEDSYENNSILDAGVGQKGKITKISRAIESSVGCCQQSEISSKIKPRSVRRLRSMGIEDGKEVKIITKQPFGPVIVETGNVQTAIGRGMSGKIYMKVYKI